jgi:general secretion pathway protein J
MTRRSGMTLIEVLVAMLVFALVAAAAALSLRLATDARDQLSSAEARLAELEIARLLIKEDLAQVVARRTRDEFGDTFGPAFLGGVETRIRPPVPGETLLAAFVRGGWANPEYDAPRSSLQFVEYLVRDGALIRRTRPFLDDARGQPRHERVLMGAVRDVSIRFLGAPLTAIARDDPDAGWQVGWPIPGASYADAPPRALALTVTMQRYGSMRLAFWIGETAGQPFARDQSGAGEAPREGDAAEPDTSEGAEPQ